MKSFTKISLAAVVSLVLSTEALACNAGLAPTVDGAIDGAPMGAAAGAIIDGKEGAKKGAMAGAAVGGIDGAIRSEEYERDCVAAEAYEAESDYLAVEEDYEEAAYDYEEVADDYSDMAEEMAESFDDGGMDEGFDW